jgi:hypothetical protein
VLKIIFWSIFSHILSKLIGFWMIIAYLIANLIFKSEKIPLWANFSKSAPTIFLKVTYFEPRRGP